MGILTKITLGLVVIVGGVAIAVPTIYKTKINDVIVQNQSKLEREGMIVSLKVDNDDFFHVKREYKVTIKDSSYILNKTAMVTNSPEFHDVKTNLDDTQILINVNLPKYPGEQNAAVIISLDEFSPSVKQNLEKEKIGQGLIDFVKNRGLMVSFDFEEYKLKQAKLKDINLSLQQEDSKLTQKTQNFVVKFGSLSNYKINLDNFELKMNDKDNQFSFNLSSYKHEVSKKDDLNADELVNISNLLIAISSNKVASQNITFGLNDIHSKSNIFTKENNVLALSNMNIKQINFKSNMDTFEIGNFDTTLSLKDLNKELITDIYAAVQNGGVSDQTVLNEYIQELLSNGFNFNLEKFQIDYAKINLQNKKFNTGKISLQSNVILEENTIDMKTRPILDFLSVVTSSLNIQMSKDDITLIMSKFRLPEVFMQFVRIENDKANIDAEFKNKELYVNNKRVL